MHLAHSSGPHLGTGIARGGWRSRMAEGAVEERPRKPSTSTPTLWGDTGETGGATPGGAGPDSGPCRQLAAGNGNPVDGRKSLPSHLPNPDRPRYTITRPPNLPHRSILPHRSTARPRRIPLDGAISTGPSRRNPLDRAISRAMACRRPGDRPGSSRRRASRGAGWLRAAGGRDPPRLGVFAISHAGAKAMPPRA